MAKLYDIVLHDSVNILFTIVFILVLIGLCFLLFISILKSAKKSKVKNTENINDGLVSKERLNDAINTFIKRFRFDNEMTLIMYEYNDLKSIRDTFGDRQYERISRILLNRVLKILPKNTLIAQTNPEQYAILIRGTIGIDKIKSFASSIIDLIEEPLLMQVFVGSKINVSVSMGIVTYPDGGQYPYEMYKNVEMALYSSKKDGTNKFVIYSKHNNTDNDHINYYQQIKEAMRNNEFVLIYQPIIDVLNKQITCFEALIRWNHPTLGIIPPKNFLNIMEHTGDIIWVGKWGIEVICKQYIAWQKKYPGMDFMISINISPKQLLEPQISQDFNSIVKRYHLNPKNICLEIVEFAMFEKYGIISENIKKLHDIGFKIAIDDFGLDVNSLSRISSLPIDIIKFEKAFFEKANENYMMEKVLNMLVTFARDRNKSIVAEGVENQEIIKKVLNFGIHVMQGYAFLKPSSTIDVEAYINDKVLNAQLESISNEKD